MEQLTTYRAKGKEIGLEFLFKYDLNGNLKLFEVVEGSLDERQQNWLFKGYIEYDTHVMLAHTTKEFINRLKVRFPATEEMIIKDWLKNKEMATKFEITVAPANLTFDAAWELFGHKIKKFESEERWKKATEATKIKVFTSIPAYKKYVERKGIAQTNFATYIHKRYYDDDWSKA